MTVWQSWVRQWYLSLGATAQVQFYGIYLFSLRGGQRAAAAAIAAVEAAMHACFAASCLHAVHVLCAMCARMAVACDRGVMWAHTALHRASEARAGGRDTPHCLSYIACACQCYVTNLNDHY